MSVRNVNVYGSNRQCFGATVFHMNHRMIVTVW